jgi:hypothetical protein
MAVPKALCREALAPVSTVERRSTAAAAEALHNNDMTLNFLLNLPRYLEDFRDLSPSIIFMLVSSDEVSLNFMSAPTNDAL